jgi:hypothetical protein
MKSIFFLCGPLMTGHRFTEAVIWEIVLWMGGIILYSEQENLKHWTIIELGQGLSMNISM